MLTLLLTLTALATPPNDTRRPFYLISHCTNDLARIDVALAGGANGVEIDVPLRDGRLQARHGGLEPRECGTSTPADRFEPLLDRVATEMDLGRLALLVVDAKETQGQGERYGRVLGSTLHNAGISADRVVVSIPVSQAEPIRAGLDQAGYDARIDLYWDDYAVTTPKHWLAALGEHHADVAGVGMDPIAFWRPMPWWTEWLAAMTDARDDGTGPAFTYYWTINEPESARAVLDQGLDGLITNHPERVRPLLDEPRYARAYRLATTSETLP